MAETGNKCKHTHTRVERTKDYKIVYCNLCGLAIDITNYSYKTFGVAKEFDTEGDMYECITGRRSAVLDGE